MRRLEGKIALITGSAQGIGLACAELFVKEGAFVYLTDIQEASEAAQRIGARYMHLDASKEEAWDKAIAQVLKEKGKLDILINNAGIIGLDESFGPADPEHSSLESWHAIHEVNLDSVFLGCKKAIEVMKKSGGSIINMSSRSGIVGIPGAAAYASSKAAVRNHTKSVALYCCQNGYKIRCNSIHPAAILTPLWDAMLGDDREAGLKAIARGVPMGHIGEPIDVAYAAVYLASEESKYMTGTEITIDGGILAGSSAAPGK